jgi:glycerate 2-kinase
VRDLLLASFQAAVDAADPRKVLSSHLPKAEELKRFPRVLVVGAGKAAGSMAAAVEAHWLEQGLSLSQLSGLVITRYGHAAPTESIEIIEAGHPVPDQAGELAAHRILEMASGLAADDLLLVLISGGGSSLLSLPVPEVPMSDLKATTQALLACGAPIQEMNIVRKHLSRIQGGRLVQATPARVFSLVISDVPGDDLSAIASGPTVPDPSSFEDALEVLERWEVAVPASVLSYLRQQQGVSSKKAETPKPGNPIFSRCETRLVATASQSLAAAARVFRQQGIQTLVLGDAIAGEARDVAQVVAAIAKEAHVRGEDSLGLASKRPLAIVSGGECTVTLKGRRLMRDQGPTSERQEGEIQQNAPTKGPRGGRCSEFLLALTRELEAIPDAWALAADTDGIDGSETNAGAFMGPDTLVRAAKLGLNPRKLLDGNDSWGFFAALDDLIVTGPTLTNVNDYRVVLLV